MEDHINKDHLPVECNICNQIFHGNKELSKHAREKYGFECAICKRKFLTEKALLDHINQKHNPLNERREKPIKKTTEPKNQKKIKKV